MIEETANTVKKLILVIALSTIGVLAGGATNSALAPNSSTLAKKALGNGDCPYTVCNIYGSRCYYTSVYNWCYSYGSDGCTNLSCNPDDY